MFRHQSHRYRDCTEIQSGGNPYKVWKYLSSFQVWRSVSLEYLNSFCEVLGCRPIKELYEKSKSQLYQNMEEAKENSSSTGDVKPNFEERGLCTEMHSIPLWLGFVSR